jgi:thiopeptide-type bacteriocin biosynthesis protein
VARTFEPSGFFVLRSPLLPWETLAAFGAGLDAARDGGALEEALDRDRARLRARLRELVALPFVREALFLASPSLDESLPHWLLDPESERGQKVEHTLVKYIARMAGRATPFGLFSGCSTGTIAARTRLEVAPRATWQRHTRLDGEYLATLTQALRRDPAPEVVLRPSSSLYRAAGRIRYAAARHGGSGVSYQLVAVEPSPHLEAALETAREGASVEAVAAAVAEAAGASHEDAHAFVLELVRGQILVSGLEPPVTGAEPIHDLIAQLRGASRLERVADRLEATRDALAAIDASGLGATPAGYRAIAASLAELEAKVELPRLFQVDLVKPAPAATLGEAVVSEIARGVLVLARLAPRSEGELETFAAAFTRRYEARLVPLVEALDEESGIGFARSENPGAEASPLLKGIAFPPGSEEASVAWGPREAWLLRELSLALKEGRHEIELTAAALDEIAPAAGARPLPDAFAALAVVAAASDAALEAGRFRVLLEDASGPSGAILLGRFCHADPALCERVKEHLRAEEAHRPEAIFAEIVHCPEGRHGNLIQRPVLRSHEIPFLGRSGAPVERQIPITDLLVSVVDGRVRLRSSRLGREVIPRLTSAFNFQHRSSQGLHRFLGALQYQGVTGGLRFSWGALDGAPFLPRVASGKVVLSRARWNVPLAKLGLAKKPTKAEVFGRVQALRAEHGLPRVVALVDADNVLPVDLENALAVEAFIQLVKERPSVSLMEVFPDAAELCARGPEGRFVHEIVVPFVRTREPGREPPTFAVSSPGDRTFPPGSPWLFAKLYTGTASADQVLREVVTPLVASVRAEGAATGWFFLRYADPDWHVRLRLRGDPAVLLPRLHEALRPLLADGRVHRVALDTYEREVERYGGARAIALVEQVFEIDSDAVLTILETLDGDAGADARWRLAVRGIDALLADFGLDLGAKRKLVSEQRESFGRELGAGDPFWRQLGERFRRERASLEALLDRTRDEGSPFAPGLEAFAARTERLRPVIAALREAPLTVPLTEVLASLVHMHVNRLLRSGQRAHEVVLHYFLDRLYEGQEARSRSRT